MRWLLRILAFTGLMALWFAAVRWFFFENPEWLGMGVVAFVLGIATTSCVTYWWPDFFSSEERVRSRLRQIEARGQAGRR